MSKDHNNKDIKNGTEDCVKVFVTDQQMATVKKTRTVECAKAYSAMIKKTQPSPYIYGFQGPQGGFNSNFSSEFLGYQSPQTSSDIWRSVNTTLKSPYSFQTMSGNTPNISTWNYSTKPFNFHDDSSEIVGSPKRNLAAYPTDRQPSDAVLLMMETPAGKELKEFILSECDVVMEKGFEEAYQEIQKITGELIKEKQKSAKIAKELERVKEQYALALKPKKKKDESATETADKPLLSETGPYVWDFNKSAGDTIKEKYEQLVRYTKILCRMKGAKDIAMNKSVSQIFATASNGFEPAASGEKYYGVFDNIKVWISVSAFHEFNCITVHSDIRVPEGKYSVIELKNLVI